MVGKPTHPRWQDRLFGSLRDEVIRGSGDIEVYVMSGDRAEPAAPPASLRPPRSPASHYVGALLAVTAATLLAFGMYGRFEVSDLILVYLLATVFVATRFGRGPSTLAATLPVLVFDFCFVPPRFSFAVHDVKYILTFLVMLGVGLIVSGLATRVRKQAEAARRRAETLATLYEATRQLSAGGDVPGLAAAPARGRAKRALRARPRPSARPRRAPGGFLDAGGDLEATKRAWRSGPSSTPARPARARTRCPGRAAFTFLWWPARARWGSSATTATGRRWRRRRGIFWKP